MRLSTDPIYILLKEHELGLRQLERLQHATGQIRDNGFSTGAFEELTETIRFLDTQIRTHSEKEEKYLFPMMEHHVVGPPAVMRGEHRELYRALDKLNEWVKDVEELRISPTVVRDLVECSETIVKLYTAHVTMENDVIFPMAKRILTKGEYNQLTRDIAATTSVTLT